MNALKSVDLASLAPRFTTRGRSEEAYSRLKPLLGDWSTAINLDGIESLSASFLDGLLLRLIEGRHLPNVLFVTREARTLEVLARLSSVRSADIRLLNEQGLVESVTPRPYRALRPRFSQSKQQLRSRTLSSSADAQTAQDA